MTKEGRRKSRMSKKNENTNEINKLLHQNTGKAKNREKKESHQKIFYVFKLVQTKLSWE